MHPRSSEAAFTLVETLIVTAIVAGIALAAGTFFLAGASPAVASAGRDVTAALAETRRTALAFDAATLVFAPAAGGGYRARVYARTPGDAGFAPRNGPEYASAVSIGEVAAPLGTPGFALAIDSRGTVTGYPNFPPLATVFAPRACPAGGAFVLRLATATQVRIVNVPCAIPSAGASPIAFDTPPADAIPPPSTPAPCPTGQACSLTPLAPAPPAVCPPGDTPDPASPALCDPPPAPAGGSGSGAPPTPGPVPAAVNPPPAGCSAPAPDAFGFAACIESNPLQVLGPAITRQGCGTHTPIADPGASFTVIVDVYRDGVLWASYTIAMARSQIPWLDQEAMPPAAICGLAYTLRFSIAGITPAYGNAAQSPSADTGDPAFADEGVGAILVAPPGSGWGSDA